MLIIHIIKRIYNKLTPPEGWRLPVFLISSIAAGLIAYLLYVSKAWSYVSDNPQTCVNCHIMAPQYATWQHSSHREVATCNDCHVPHNNALNKYYFKAKDGLRHASIFTLRAEPQVIFIKDAGKEVVQQNCIRCHSTLIDGFVKNNVSQSIYQHKVDRQCWDCHRETPHGRVNSISSVPGARVPLPESPVPNWLEDIIKNKP